MKKKATPKKSYTKYIFVATGIVIILGILFIIVKGNQQDHPVNIKQVLSADKVDSFITANTITLQSNRISPTNMTVDTKASVSWVNNDTIDHTLTFSDGVKTTIPSHKAYSRSFSQTGEVTYHVSEYTNQVGEIRITTADHSAPARGG